MTRMPRWSAKSARAISDRWPVLMGSSLQDRKSWEKNRFRAENPPSHHPKLMVYQLVTNPSPYSTSREPICLEQGTESGWQGGSRDGESRHCCAGGFPVSKADKITKDYGYLRFEDRRGWDR